MSPRPAAQATISVDEADPSTLTTRQILREIGQLEKLLDSRLNGVEEKVETRLAEMDKAIILLQAFTDRQPTTSQVDLSVDALQELQDEKFNGIALQFAERDKRTEQLSLADKTAINAALAAQEKQAIAQNDSNAAASAKMEMNFAKLIEQGQGLLMEVRRNTESQINDLKSRLDKGEGRTSISDPATVEALRQMSAAVAGLAASRDQATGGHKAASDQTAFIFGIVGMGVGVLGVLLVIFKVVT